MVAVGAGAMNSSLTFVNSSRKSSPAPPNPGLLGVSPRQPSVIIPASAKVDGARLMPTMCPMSNMSNMCVPSASPVSNTVIIPPICMSSVTTTATGQLNPSAAAFNINTGSALAFNHSVDVPAAAGSFILPENA